MEAKNSQFAVRLLPSLTDFAFLMPIVFLFGRMNGLKTLLGDCDTGWHIRTGQWILAHHTVPTHDIFSYTKPDGAWYAWEWLTDILWATLYGRGGLAAVAIAGILLIAFTFTLLFRLVRRRSNAVVAIAMTIMAAVASSVHWLARPHLFTFVFLVLFYGALDRVQKGKTHFHGIPYLVILPFATILWTNLHGGFFVGILLIGTYGVGEALKVFFASALDDGQKHAILQRSRNFLLCAFASLAASFINPYGYKLHQHMILYLSDPYQGQHVMEFLSVSFHHPLAVFFEGMLLLSALAAFWFASERSFTEPLLLLMWAHAALLATRNIPLFMIIAAPPAGTIVQMWLDRLPGLNVAEWVRKAGRKFNETAAAMTETDQITRWHPVSAFGLALLCALLYAPHPPEKFRPEFDPKSFPVAAVQKMNLKPSDRIFTFDQWGDYLIYRLYPKTKVFMDGRSDYYGSTFNQTYLDVITVNYGWEKTLSQFGVDTILMPPGTPLAGALKESSRWHVVYDDGVAVVFRPQQAGGVTNSVTGGDGTGRGREVTKTVASDSRITKNKTKT